MPTMCILCALRAFVKGQTAPTFEEDPETHLKLFHPNPEETEAERRELEDKAHRLVRDGMFTARHYPGRN